MKMNVFSLAIFKNSHFLPGKPEGSHGIISPVFLMYL